MISDRIIIVTIQFPAQTTSLGYETVCRAHSIGIQHVNMSFEHGVCHFTRVGNVLRAFVSVSELIWEYFIIKKRVSECF